MCPAREAAIRQNVFSWGYSFFGQAKKEYKNIIRNSKI